MKTRSPLALAVSLAVPSALVLVLAACSGNRAGDPKTTTPGAAAKPTRTKFASDGTPPAPPPPVASVVSSPTTPPPEPEPDSKPVRAAILKAIDGHNDEIRDCYDRHAERDPHGGRATLRFVVAPSGDVVSIGDEGSTLEDKAIVACIGKVISAQKFATWNGKAVTIVLPIDFEPNHF